MKKCTARALYALSHLAHGRGQSRLDVVADVRAEKYQRPRHNQAVEVRRRARWLLRHDDVVCVR